MTTGLDAALAEMEAQFWRRCDALLLVRTNPWELDEALVSAGFATGPCEVQDHVGLERVAQAMGQGISTVLPRMVTEGRVGKIGGVGYYRYPGGGGAVVDPLIEDLILEEARFAQVARRPISDAELVSNLSQSLAELGRVHCPAVTAADTFQAAVSRRLTCPMDMLRGA